MTTNSQELKKIREFIKNNPEKAREIILSNKEFMNMLKEETGTSRDKSKALTKSIPGIPKMYDDNGFSNYALLAFIAFIIQFLITLVCIIFYK